MANQGVEALSTVLATYQNGGNVTQTVTAAATAVEKGGGQNAVNASLAAAQLVDSAVSSIGKNLPAVINTVDGKIPVAGVVLSTASALNNAQQVINALPSGKIPQSQAIGAIGDAAGAIGGAALALAAVAAGTAGAVAVVATLGAALTVASVGLAIASVAVGDATWDVPDVLKDAIDGLEKLRDTLGDAFDSAYESIKDTVSDFLSDAGDFVDYLKDRGFDNLLKDAADFWIPNNIKDWWDRAKNWVWPRDPIILDLDGNGLETFGLASNVYFDHDGDGVLTKTGWAGKNDALLVWDRNANGTIDTGAELFGDFTVLPNGTLAPNGFAALAALDANGDGIIDASDPAFAELKLWRDTSQDGISQGGEFITFAEAGIVSLNLANALKNQNLANGNQLSREGGFTRADGSTSAMGEFRLASDTFSTKFADPVEVPESLKTLPTMGGAGNVRELQQAAAQSGGVAGVLAQFQSATTRTEQKALLDQLITAWADTSGMAKSLEERAAGKYRIQYEAFGNERRSSSIDTVAFAAVSSGSVGGSSGGAALMTDFGGMYLSERYRNLIAEWSRKLHVLEAFNGQYFFNLPEKKSQTDGANWGLHLGGIGWWR